MLQALNRQQLQLFISLRLWTNRLTHALPHLNLERLEVAHSAAGWKALDQLGCGRQRFRLLSEFVDRIRLPVERGVGAAALDGGQLGKPFDRLLPLRLLEILLTAFVLAVFTLALALHLLAFAILRCRGTFG